jgi:circadian clock protein KaiC
VGLPLGQLVEAGQVELLWYQLYESSLDEIGHALIEVVVRRGVRRLFIDGSESLVQTLGQAGRLGTFLTALRNTLRTLGVTTLFSFEIRTLFGPQLEFPITGLSPVADNIIFMRIGEIDSRIYRLISILKMRKTGYDPTIREVVIGRQGLRIAEPFADTETVLTGTPKIQRESTQTTGSDPQQESSEGHENDSDR